MSMASAFGERLVQLRAQHALKMLRYLTGSVVATVVSTVTFLVTFGPGLLGSRGASLSASATGAVANYFLNRRWTWQRRGRADVRRELLPYWATVVATALVAAVATGFVNAIVRDHTDNRSVRTLVNTLTFLGVYAVSFVVKYVVFDRLFAGGGSPAAQDGGDSSTGPGSNSLRPSRLFRRSSRSHDRKMTRPNR
jgi:putative flippase GtrA